MSRTQTAPHPAQVLEELGYAACSSVSALKEVLAQFPKPKEQDVALIVGMMARTHTAGVDGSAVDDTGSSSSIPLYTSFSSPLQTEDSRDIKAWDTTVFVDTMKELVCSI